MVAPFQFELTGGTLCLDFANTVDKRPSAENRADHLNSYADLLQWSVQSGIVTKTEAESLFRRSLRNRKTAGSVFVRAIKLREAFYGIVSAVARGVSPKARDLVVVNAELRMAMSRSQIFADRTAFSWQWEKDSNALTSPLWPVVKSAADLLTSDRLKSVRECAADDCAWLFIDRSTNQRRRWCDMKVCGNRAKARRHYRLTKARRRKTQPNQIMRSR